MKKLVNIAKSVSYSNQPFADLEGFEPTIGWFSNKYNPAGWSIVPLTNIERLWLSNSDIELENVFRVISDNRRTSLIKFDLIKGTYAFLDNKILEDENKIVFERKEHFYSFKVELNNDLAKSEFGVA